MANKRVYALLLVCLLGSAVCRNADADAQVWVVTGSLNTAREHHTATLLPNGNVLVVGGDNGTTYLNSAELYNPTAGVWTSTGNLNIARTEHTATLLPNGNVLVAGGAQNGVNAPTLNSAELYNPITGVWTSTGNLNTARYYHTATLLPNGNVLVVGGADNAVVFLNSSELYNYTTGVWTLTGSLNVARKYHTATQLLNGRVLVTGGQGTGTVQPVPNTLIFVERYPDTPTTDLWALTDNLNTEREYHTATRLLPTGDVLVVGGDNNYAFLSSAELHNAITGVWTLTGSLNTARYWHTATLLPNGNVLVVGGYNSAYLNVVELYNPSTGAWTLTSNLNAARGSHTATLLPNGNVLVVGGYNGAYLNSTELYICPVNWNGTFCDVCSANYFGSDCISCSLCEHGATCTDGLAGYCNCPSNWNGAFCDVCTSGFFGPTCSPCLYNCTNGGFCNDGLAGNGTCSCLLGFSGNECETASCQKIGCNDNGICLNSGNCSCVLGWSGVFCNVQQACQYDSCQNGGNCVIQNENNFASCICQPGYNGSFCETPVSCRSNRTQCQNDGVCTVVSSTSVACVCPAGYNGTFCEEAYGCRLEENACQNGGLCVASSCAATSNSEVFCSCPTTFRGARCEVTVSNNADIYYLLAALGGIALVTVPLYLIIYRSRRHTAISSTYWLTGLMRLPLLFAGVFDTISDAFFILVVSQSNSPAYYGSALAFTILPFVLNLSVALYVSIRGAWRSEHVAEQASWFCVVLSTFLAGDVGMALTLAQSMLVIHIGHATTNDPGRLRGYAAAFGTNAFQSSLVLFCVQFLFKDVTHAAIQASFLASMGEVNPIVVLALAATALSSAVGLFSFVFFTLIPLAQSRNHDGKQSSVSEMSVQVYST